MSQQQHNVKREEKIFERVSILNVSAFIPAPQNHTRNLPVYSCAPRLFWRILRYIQQSRVRGWFDWVRVSLYSVTCQYVIGHSRLHFVGRIYEAGWKYMYVQLWRPNEQISCTENSAFVSFESLYNKPPRWLLLSPAMSTPQQYQELWSLPR